MASERNQHLFSGARNTTIHGGTFTNVAGNMIVNATDSRYGLKLLLASIAHGAFHDAAERGEPPKCHPHTRVAILDEIMQWIKDPGIRQRFITWIYGPAGSGKTAIAQSIAEACEKEGRLAASFFFGRLASGRNTSMHFVATIAYQLSRSIPEIEDRLLTSIEKDPSIFSRSLSTQMRVLIVEPLKSVPLHSLARLVVVDGVDECGPNDQVHAELLRVLGAAMNELKNIPIVFLIASRPEYEIRTTFNRNPLSSLTRSLVLDDKYKPDIDIKIYFESKFCEIQQEHFPLLRERWPAERDINLLISKASGQFIFAATVVKFIDSPRHSPMDRLKIILGLTSAGNETPFALLDALYRFILGSVADIQKVLEILTLLLLADNSEKNLALDNAEELLGFDIRRALVDMHALMFVPPLTDNSLPQIYHASLYDFLKDQSRSLQFYIDENQGHAYLARRWLKIIGICAQSRNETSVAVTTFVAHCGHLNSSASEELIDDLAHLNFRASLEGVSRIWSDIHRPDWVVFMKCVKQLRGSRDDIFLRLQNDFGLFILHRIGRYPQSLQPYIPILLLGRSGWQDVFHILLHGASKSAEEFNSLLDIDRSLLHISNSNDSNIRHPIIYELLMDRTKAGKCFIDGGSYAALAKAIVDVVCAKPGELNFRIEFFHVTHGCYHYLEGLTMRMTLKEPHFKWFEDILDEAPVDLDLANILRQHAAAIQFGQPSLGQKGIAKASIRYIKQCDLLLADEGGLPSTNINTDTFNDDRTKEDTLSLKFSLTLHT